MATNPSTTYPHSAAAAAAAATSAAVTTVTAAINTTAVPVAGTVHASPAKLQLIQQRPHPQTQVPARPQIQSIPPIGYPLASSGRGFINSSSTPRPHPQTVAVSNPNPNPSSAAYSAPSMGYPPAPPPRHFRFAPSPPPLAKGFPVSAHPHHFKVNSSVCSLPDCVGGHKVSSDGVRDDVCVLVRGRKVRISNGASIYALCRSWLRNGHPEETQPQFPDIVKSLPKPAPASSSDKYSPKRKKAEEEEENDMDEKAVESLSSNELLKLHIKRAKRVRERLREERLQRIARYKSRLALLLPPLVEQCGNDTSDGG